MEGFDEDIPILVSLDDTSNNKIEGNIDKIIPVTILTGFLGAGKTTLLTYLLTEHHGKRIAVIENELSAGLGVESMIAKSGVTGKSLDGFFELNNGCICCTVKDSLLTTLEQLAEHSDKFDYILIEMTGVANPGPVISTFWLDDILQTVLKLDGVVCLVDAYNIEKYLNSEDTNSDVLMQIGYANRIIINKCDLVASEDQIRIKDLISNVNSIADIQLTSFSKVSPQWVLDIDGFSTKQAIDTVMLCNPCKPISESHNAIKLSTYSFIFYGKLNLITLQRYLDGLLYQGSSSISQHGSRNAEFNENNKQEIFRMKGILHIEQQENDIEQVEYLYILQAVHEIFDIKKSNIEINSMEDKSQNENRIVIIGKRIDTNKIKEGFISCISNSNKSIS